MTTTPVKANPQEQQKFRLKIFQLRRPQQSLDTGLIDSSSDTCIIASSESDDRNFVSSIEDSYHNDELLPLARELLRRRRRRDTIQRQLSNRMISEKKKTKRTLSKKESIGTKFTFSKPTQESVNRWFSLDPYKAIYYGINPIQFNHNCAGMTNPCLRVADKQDINCCLNTNIGNKDDTVVPESCSNTGRMFSGFFSRSSSLSHASIITAPSCKTTSTFRNDCDGHSSSSYAVSNDDNYDDNDDVEHAWWPTTAVKSHNQRPWRMIRLRCRVGVGEKCYSQVRDAILDWQFTTKDETQGIMRVFNEKPNPNNQQQRRRGRNNSYRSNPTPLSYDVLPQQVEFDDVKNNANGVNDIPSQNIQQIWSGPHINRCLVTFSSSFIPNFYALNPAMVVYDLVDQRGQGTTYTSTAYATLKGHLLSGEERVTVALRDPGDSFGNKRGLEFVDIEILSFSRPAPTIKGRAIWPLIGNMQERFFTNQMETLKEIAAASSAAASALDVDNKAIKFTRGR